VAPFEGGEEEEAVWRVIFLWRRWLEVIRAAAALADGGGGGFIFDVEEEEDLVGSVGRMDQWVLGWCGPGWAENNWTRLRNKWRR
jgi:hypothetical protein